MKRLTLAICFLGIRIRLSRVCSRLGAAVLRLPIGLTAYKAPITNLVFHECIDNVVIRLDGDVTEAGGACTLCGTMLDNFGIHYQCCITGGDAERVRNSERQVVTVQTLDSLTRVNGLPPTDAAAISRRTAELYGQQKRQQ